MKTAKVHEAVLYLNKTDDRQDIKHKKTDRHADRHTQKDSPKFRHTGQN